MTHRPVVATTVLAAALLAAGCSRKGPGGPPRVPVTIARAEQRPIPFEITATGTVEPLQTASVQAQVTGILTAVAFHEGDDVAAGQLLFQIDPRPFQAALAQARGMLGRDVAQAQNAQLEADRYGELVKQDYVTKQDYDERRANADALRASVRADSAAVTNAQLHLEWEAIRAPIPGRTGRLLLRAGNLVRANSADPLVVINQIHPILVRFAVPQDRKSTRLNSSHTVISYAVFCLKKKKTNIRGQQNDSSRELKGRKNSDRLCAELLIISPFLYLCP